MHADILGSHLYKAILCSFKLFENQIKRSQKEGGKNNGKEMGKKQRKARRTRKQYRKLCECVLVWLDCEREKKKRNRERERLSFWKKARIGLVERKNVKRGAF